MYSVRQPAFAKVVVANDRTRRQIDNEAIVAQRQFAVYRILTVNQSHRLEFGDHVIAAKDSVKPVRSIPKRHRFERDVAAEEVAPHEA